MAIPEAAARFQSTQFQENPEAPKPPKPPGKDSEVKTQTAKRGGRHRNRQGRTNGQKDGTESNRLEDAIDDLTITDAEAAKKGEEIESGEVCVICASDIVYQAIPPCNHRSCHVCSLRLRSLYKTTGCPQCRTPCEMVIFSRETKETYQDIPPTSITNVHVSLGIKFTGADVYEATMNLLKFQCPSNKCKYSAPGMGELREHVSKAHQRSFCGICVENKKIFPHEHDIYTRKELEAHNKYGKAPRDSTFKDGFSGHPECGFCNVRFYGDDELYAHCRDNHERCHICDRRVTDGRYQYYFNYDELEVHFKNAHFPCIDKECLEQKFVVFESELDLQSHEIDRHGAVRPHNRVTRSLQRVNLAEFPDLRPTFVPETRGPNRRRNEGQQNSSSTRLVHGTTSGGMRSFGGALSHGQTQGDGPLADIPDPAVEEARRRRQETLFNRVRQLVRNDENKVAQFRQLVSEFRRTAITSDMLVSQLIDLLDAPTIETGIVIRELSDSFDETDRRDSLNRAWNDWMAINENFPALGAPSGMSSSSISRPSWSTRKTNSRATPGAYRAEEHFPALSAPSRPAPPSLAKKGKITLPAARPAANSSAGPSRPNGTSATAATQSAYSSLPTAIQSSSAQPAAAKPKATAPVAAPRMTRDAFPSLPSGPKGPVRLVSRGASAGNAVINPNKLFEMASGKKQTFNAWGQGEDPVEGSSQSAQPAPQEGKKSGRKQKLVFL